MPVAVAKSAAWFASRANGLAAALESEAFASVMEFMARFYPPRRAGSTTGTQVQG
jgi:nitrate/nitrite transporter NarK